MKRAADLEHPLYRLMLKRGYSHESIKAIKSEVHIKARSAFTTTMISPWNQDKAREMLEHLEKKMANLLHSLWLEEKITFMDIISLNDMLKEITGDDKGFEPIIRSPKDLSSNPKFYKEIKNPLVDPIWGSSDMDAKQIKAMIDNPLIDEEMMREFIKKKEEE